MRPPLHLDSAVSQSWVGLGWGVVGGFWTDGACVCPYTSVGAPNWSGRTPERKSPGVPATHEPSTTNSCWPSRAGLDVQLDGVRKMPQLVVAVVVVVVGVWRGGTRQTSPYSLCAECAAGCSLRPSSAGGSGRSAAGSAGSKKGRARRGETLT